MRLVWLVALVLLVPSLASAQDAIPADAPLVPTGSGWLAVAWRNWAGFAAIAIPVLVFLSNTIEPLIRDKWPAFAAGFRRMMPLSLRILMSPTLKDVIKNTTVAATEALKPSTDNVQMVESKRATATVVAPSDGPVRVTVNAREDDTPSSAAPPGMMVICIALSFGSISYLVGCGGLPPEIAKPLEDLSVSISMEDEALRAMYSAQLAACKTDECAAGVSLQWDPIIGAQQRIREAWCLIKPEAPTCPKGGVP